MSKFIANWFSVAVFMYFFSFAAQGQYTYVGLGMDYNYTAYYSPPNTTFGQRTSNTNVGISGDVLFRPYSFLAIGGSFTYVVSQNSSFSFVGSPSSGGLSYTSFRGFSTTQYEGRYATSAFDYNLENSHRADLHVKLFPSPEYGLYGEFGLVFTQIKESFIIQRGQRAAAYHLSGNLRFGSLQSIDFNFNEAHNLTAPKLGVGWLGHLKSNIYFDISMQFIFMRFPENSFELDVPFEWNSANDSHGVVTLRSQANGAQMSPNLSLKIGYFF